MEHRQSHYAGDLSKPLPSAAAKPGNGTASAYPQSWGGIGTGHIVLAKEDGPMQQWWEAKVIAQEGEAFTLEWRDHSGLPPIKRLHRNSLHQSVATTA